MAAATFATGTRPRRRLERRPDSCASPLATSTSRRRLAAGPGTWRASRSRSTGTSRFLGPNGAAFFKSRVASPVRLIAGGRGPGGSRIAAALADGSVVLLGPGGSVVRAASYAPGTIKAVLLATIGPVVQEGRLVHVGRSRPSRPSRAIVLDYRDGRVVYATGEQVRQRRVRDAAESLLVRVPLRPGERPLFLVDHGSAWADGRTSTGGPARCRRCPEVH